MKKSPCFDSDVMTTNFIQKLELTNTKDFLREVSKNHPDAQQFLCYSQPKSSVIREKNIGIWDFRRGRYKYQRCFIFLVI